MFEASNETSAACLAFFLYLYGITNKGIQAAVKPNPIATKASERNPETPGTGL